MVEYESMDALKEIYFHTLVDVHQMDYAKEEIREKIINLYETPGISIINGEILPDALNTYVDQNIDFTDAIIGISAARYGAEKC